MKSVLIPFLMAAATLIGQTALAEVTGLPEELKGVNEEQIEYNAIEELEETYGCDFTARDIKAIRKKSEFTVIESELQDEEYASYPGEFSAFVLKATLTLPAKKCKNAGTYTCEIKYDLYDELAYEIDSSLTACVKN